MARHAGMKDEQHVAAFALYELGSLLATEPEVSAGSERPEVSRVEGAGRDPEERNMARGSE